MEGPTSIQLNDSRDSLTITKRNARDSPLLRLPPEIRNTIYGYVLGGKTCTAMQKDMGRCKFRWVFLVLPYHDPANPSRIRPCPTNLTPLTVCRQIYQEAHLLPFSLNLWRFNDLDDLSSAAKDKSFPRGPQARAITHVMFVDTVDEENISDWSDRAKSKQLVFLDLFPDARHVRLDLFWDDIVSLVSDTNPGQERNHNDPYKRQLAAMRKWVSEGSDGNIYFDISLLDDGDEKGADEQG